MRTILTRTGDGSYLTLSESELRGDLKEGPHDAAERAGIPPHSDDELKHLLEINRYPFKFVSVRG
jgi:hypothetical protein